jgi:hypothetical protein
MEKNMLSYISNSDTRRPDLNYARLWIITAIAILLIVGTSEIIARVHGISPSLVDNDQLWLYMRHGVSGGEASKNQVVVMGDSRAHLGFDPGLYKKLTGQKVIMLAIGGANTWPLLRDLAENTDYCGTVIYAFRGDACFRDGSEKAMETNIRNYKDNYSNLGRYDKIFNKELEMLVQSSLAIVHIKPDDLNKLFFSPAKARARNYLVMGRDRAAKAYYRTMCTPKDIAKKRKSRVDDLRAHYKENPLPDPQWQQHMQEIGRWVKLIQDRGGRVVLVRFPTSGEHWELENKVYPRDKYWDNIPSLTGATVIHFKDIPGFENVDCPDSSHLNYDDAEKFTKAIANILTK